MFQLVFKGECVPGTDTQSARNNARALFKASVEQVDRMFSGQPVVIRNKLEEAQAEKYRAVLAKHGMVAYVQPMPGAAPVQPQAAAPAPEPAPQPKVSAPAQSAKAPEPSAPAASAAAGKVPEVEPGDRLPVAGEKVNEILSGSGLGLDPAGVTLVEAKEVEAPEFEHLDDWSVAPAGSDIGEKGDLPPPMVPDVSHLSLADEEAGGKS